LIVAETAVAEVLRECSAMRNRFGVGHELHADTVSQRNAVFHIEEKHLHQIASNAPTRRASIRSEMKRVYRTSAPSTA
jgi:hypothetical protein